jgi:hypothetical protein
MGSAASHANDSLPPNIYDAGGLIVLDLKKSTGRRQVLVSAGSSLFIVPRQLHLLARAKIFWPRSMSVRVGSGTLALEALMAY